MTKKPAKALKSKGKETPPARRTTTSGRSLWSRLGLGSRAHAAKRSPAAQKREQLQGTLPVTDPLRRARLQAHLFMTDMPSFPEPYDPSRPGKSAADTATSKKQAEDSPIKPPAATPVQESQPGAQNVEPPHDGEGQVNPSPSLESLRAEKSARKADLAKGTENPGRRRAQELRAERAASRLQSRGQSQLQQRKQTRPLDKEPDRALSAPTPLSKASRQSSAPARAAAERTPARTALAPPLAKVKAGNTLGRSRSSRSLNGLVLLAMLLAFGLFAALAWYGYDWYQTMGVNGGTPIAGNSAGTAEGNQSASEGNGIAIPSDGDLLTQTSTPIPEPLVPEPLEPESVEPDVVAETTPDILTPDALEAAAFADAVLILERELAQAYFLSSADVDSLYTLDTLQALSDLARTLNLGSLAVEVVAADLNPTRDELERWFLEIEPNL